LILSPQQEYIANAIERMRDELMEIDFEADIQGNDSDVCFNFDD